jgi:hypothetical protein
MTTNIFLLIALFVVSCVASDQFYTKADDFCIVVPLNFAKNPNFFQDEAHSVGTFFVGVATESQRQTILSQSNGRHIVVFKAVNHLRDALQSLQAGVDLCKAAGRRMMFVYEMDVQFTRFAHSTAPPNRTLSELIIDALVDIVNENHKPFWMLGSLYMGPLQNIPDPTHLNGNAIYDTSSRCFEMAMHHLRVTNSDVGYDVTLSRMVHHFPAVCNSTYVTTPRICNYWRGVHVPKPECWFVHN